MWIDSHCHLDLLEKDLTSTLSILADVDTSKISDILVPATKGFLTDINPYKLFLPHVRIWQSIGFHPWFLQGFASSNIETIENDCFELLELYFKDSNGKTIAIGECGLDKPYANKQVGEPTCFAKQISVFNAHCQIAKKLNKPLIVHNIKGQQEILNSIKQAKLETDRLGVIHGFSGSYELAKQFLDAGFYLGIGGTITYPRAIKTRETLSRLPIDRILLETDSPSMPVYNHQGKINTPDKIILIAEEASLLMRLPLEKLAEQTRYNFQTLFALEQLN